ncbi:MAG: hypothetical protein BWY06_02944 [Candidatus Latescibacteria bacterium ADurb.Bin168]|nr:MAG: hypothetical protein BWY06_02944 [Candidatus Latescibacteria bacterium ADurb.Bin168]
MSIFPREGAALKWPTGRSAGSVYRDDRLHRGDTGVPRRAPRDNVRFASVTRRPAQGRTGCWEEGQPRQDRSSSGEPAAAPVRCIEMTGGGTRTFRAGLLDTTSASRPSLGDRRAKSFSNRRSPTLKPALAIGGDVYAGRTTSRNWFWGPSTTIVGRKAGASDSGTRL